MKVSKYGRSVKITAVILQILSTTVCAVCIGIVSCNAVISIPGIKNTIRRNYYVNPFSRVVSFEESDVFNELVYDSLGDVVRYCVIRDQLETDGRLDETKEIDIEQYARHFEEVPVTETSVCYRLGDLVQWGQGGISFAEYPYAEVAEMIDEAKKADAADTDTDAGVETPPRFIEWAEDGSSAVIEEYRLYHVETAENVSVTADISEKAAESTAAETVEETAEEIYIQVPVEQYLPVGGRSLLSGVDTVEELVEMTGYLQETVQMLQDNYSLYRVYREYYDRADTNFRYCIIKENNGVEHMYTNVPEWTEGVSREVINTYFASMGRYLCFSPADFTFETDTIIREEQVREIWNDYRYAFREDASVWIGVDTSYGFQDTFATVRQSYQIMAPGYLFVLIGLFSGIVSLVLFGFLTYVSGKKQGTEGITLIWFDRWFTEIAMTVAAVVVTTLFMVTGIAVSEFFWGALDRARTLETLAVGTVLTCSAVLFFWCSLIRRVRAHTFWNNFLIFRILLKCRNLLMRIYDDSRNVVRVWVPYLLFVGVNVLLIGGITDGVVPALALDILVGIFLYRSNHVRRRILEGIGNIRDGNLDYQIDVEKMHGDNRILAEAVNTIGNGIWQAVETSVKDERLKADLITNVSHDIKTPLTSIINYVDLIKREPVENEKIRGYLEVLDNKSQRLKQLTEDLVEVSKISSGNIILQCDKLDLIELMHQAMGEFSEKFEERGLQTVAAMAEKPVLIYADSRRIWRVIENLFNNVYKYALEHTRVYVEIKELPKEDGTGQVRLSIKNISEQPLRVGVEDLTERFIRGDVSRSTEGSGLGLSIAKNLTELQKGKFEIVSDGDLFKVVITFPLMT